MTTTGTPTLDAVLTLAQRLAPADKLRLIARLAPDLAAVLPSPDDAAWDELLQLGNESAAQPPLAEDSAAVVSAMRR